jgi:NAD(P)H dehydrogenase (quinone)
MSRSSSSTTSSFNGALFDVVVATLTEAGHTAVTSDLYRMPFNPVFDCRNFVSVKDVTYLKH